MLRSSRHQQHHHPLFQHHLDQTASPSQSVAATPASMMDDRRIRRPTAVVDDVDDNFGVGDASPLPASTTGHAIPASLQHRQPPQQQLPQKQQPHHPGGRYRYQDDPLNRHSSAAAAAAAGCVGGFLPDDSAAVFAAQHQHQYTLRLMAQVAAAALAASPPGGGQTNVLRQTPVDSAHLNKLHASINNDSTNAGTEFKQV